MTTTEPVVRHIVGTATRYMCGEFRTEPWPRQENWIAPHDSVMCERCHGSYVRQRERQRQRRIDRSVHKCPDCRCGR